MLPLLRQCCCGCPLRTGVLLVAAYQMVRGLFEVVTDALVLHLNVERHHELGWQLALDIISVVVLVLGALKVIAAFFLIFGVNKERHRLVFWWLIFTMAITITDATCLFINAIDFLIYSINGLFIIILIFALLDIGFSAYFLLVVYSYYRIVEEKTPSTVRLTI